MGCCISKSRTRQPPKPSDGPPCLPSQYHAGSSPSQPSTHPAGSLIALEEEAVKEIVLSEIPPPPPPPPAPLRRPLAKEDDCPLAAARPQPLASSPQPKPVHQVFDQLSTPRKLDVAESDILISKLEEAAGVVSEYSDMYTLSESVSVSTTPTTGTATTLNDSEATSKPSRPVSSNATKKVPRKRPPISGRDERPDRGAAFSHTRRLRQPSPNSGRRGASQGRDPGGVRRSDGQAGVDSGRRRSSSPAQGRAGDGIRGGTRSTGYGSNIQRCKVPDRSDGVRGANDNDYAASESLDNTHVSLECFIFL